MARVTIDDCLKKVDNRFSLIHLAAARARQLKRGSRALVPNKNKFIVIALREIAAGLVTYDNLKTFEQDGLPEEAELRYGAPLRIEVADE
ncbi:MAG: DNA-directed RNA polymerase subunit omega [Deltaproteobacteria bacterium]|jgi:DNA-directed RNA polymerase subunit omega|nr:DNA-directed RNA polymerase subunit omega [Deltaproteobacteria bacterium]